MNNGKPMKSFQRFTWLMLVTIIAAGLIAYDAWLTGQVDKTALGMFTLVIANAGKQLYDQHAAERESEKPKPPEVQG